MTMHLMGPQFTTTNTRKRKPKNKTKSQIQAEKDHEKFLKRMGVHPEQREQRARSLTAERLAYNELTGRLPGGGGSNPPGPTIPSGDNGIGYHPSMGKRKENVYTGTEIIGIATMHKSNAVPVRNKKSAEEVAKMRRG